MNFIKDPYKLEKRRYNPISHKLSEKELDKRHQERLKYESSPDLAPLELHGFPRTYHYRDVRLRVPWQLSGEYDNKINSVKKMGIKRGDLLQFSFDPHNISDELDPDNVVVSWRGIKLGDMQKTRLRLMVKNWLKEGLPVFCAMAFPSDDNLFFLELGFYGRPRTSKREDS